MECARASSAGWRIQSELLTCRWSHVDFVSGWIRLEPGETTNRRGRMFHLTPQLRSVLEAQKKHTEALERADARIIATVFHRRGKPIRNFYAAWRAACRVAGVPGRIPHDFRRTAVRNFERAGVARSAAMAMVGHQTEAIYVVTRLPIKRCSRMPVNNSPRRRLSSRPRRQMATSCQSQHRRDEKPGRTRPLFSRTFPFSLQ